MVESILYKLIHSLIFLTHSFFFIYIILSTEPLHYSYVSCCVLQYVDDTTIYTYPKIKNPNVR